MGQKEPKQLARGNAKHTLLWVELQVDLAQISKCLLQILNMDGIVAKTKNRATHISFNVSVELWLETNLDCPCKNGPGTL